MNFFKKCEYCRKHRVYFAKQEIQLVNGPAAKSKKLICNPCLKKVAQIVKGVKK